MIRLLVWQAPNHLCIVWILLVQALVVGEGDLEVLVELLKDELVEEREALWGVVTTQHSLVQAVLEHVEVAAE